MRRSLILLALSLASASPAAAQAVLPVPAVTIYPREVIRDDMIEDQEIAARAVGGPALAESRRALVGKVARATLLPGRPIPLNAVEEPKLVTLGAQVRIVFQQSGVSITAFGAALQPGAAGDLVRVRNADSGLTVSGVVQPDGSVRVGDG
jgi:flagella basal body P-ring formation protein FlgA